MPECPTEIPWYAPGHAASQQGQGYTPQLRERVVDAHEAWQAGGLRAAVPRRELRLGVPVPARRRAGVWAAIRPAQVRAEAESQRQRLIGEGWKGSRREVRARSRYRIDACRSRGGDCVGGVELLQTCYCSGCASVCRRCDRGVVLRNAFMDR